MVDFISIQKESHLKSKVFFSFFFFLIFSWFFLGITPFRGDLTRKEEVFNECISQLRVVVENSISQVKSLKVISEVNFFLILFFNKKLKILFFRFFPIFPLIQEIQLIFIKFFIFVVHLLILKWKSNLWGEMIGFQIRKLDFLKLFSQKNTFFFWKYIQFYFI